MKYKIIDWIIACLILVNIYFYLPFINVEFIKGIFRFYSGMPLVLAIIKIALLFIIMITTAILFLRNSRKAKWALSGYIGLSLLFRMWIINPNSEAYFKELREAQKLLQSGEVITYNISAWPSWWILALYVIGLIYVFTLRERYKKV